MEALQERNLAMTSRKTTKQPLRIIRLLAGLTQATVAKKSGWSQSFVSSMERGLVELTEERIQIFCNACGAKDEGLQQIIKNSKPNQMPSKQLQALYRICNEEGITAEDLSEFFSATFS